MVFYLRAGEDFFSENTKLQLFCINNPILWEVFEKKQLGQRSGVLKQQTVDRLIKCLKDLKVDIDEDLHQYLF